MIITKVIKLASSTEFATKNYTESDHEVIRFKLEALAWERG